MAWGLVPAAKGEPGTAVNAPLVGDEHESAPAVSLATDNCIRGGTRGSRCADDCDRAGGCVNAIGRERIVCGIGDVEILGMIRTGHRDTGVIGVLNADIRVTDYAVLRRRRRLLGNGDVVSARVTRGITRVQGERAVGTDLLQIAAKWWTRSAVTTIWCANFKCQT